MIPSQALSRVKADVPAVRRCTYCVHYDGFELSPAGPCLEKSHIVVVAFDAPRCHFYASAAAITSPEVFANSQAPASPIFFHQRRCSTADDSGLQES